jgi:uncharacterized protein YutE (UPF0331/DUF86 family)
MLTPAEREDLTLTNLFRKDLGLEISEWASVRNKLAHEYIDIRWDAIKEFIKESQPLLTEFTNNVKTYLLNSLSDGKGKRTLTNPTSVDKLARNP